MGQKIEQKPYVFTELRHLVDAYPSIIYNKYYDEDASEDADKRQRIRMIAQLRREAVINLKGALDTIIVTLAQATKLLYTVPTSLNFKVIFSNDGIKALKNNFISFENVIQCNHSILSDMLSKQGLAYIIENGTDPNDAKEIQKRLVPHFNKNDASASRRLQSRLTL